MPTAPSPGSNFAEPTDPFGRRRLLHMARVATANGRWRRYQEAAARRGWDRERGRVERRMDLILAHSRWMGRVALFLRCGLWDLHIKTALGGQAARTLGVISYAQAGPDPEAHPRALFDQAWYLERNPDLVAKGWCPLAHYLTVGDAAGCDPHPLFDLADYRARHAVKIAACGLTALQHFVYSGAREGFAPHPLFDVRHYVGQCEAVAVSGENPLAHYLRQGWREGLDPHPLFAGDWYLAHSPDARAADIAPLLHYVLVGSAEGRSPHPLFNPTWYAERHGEGGLRSLVESAEQPRDPSPYFDSTFYMTQQPDLPADLHPLVHYLTEGAFEGVSPAAGFDEAAYLAANPRAAQSPLSALEHWARSRDS
jgi:hypothetical protein